MEQLKEEKMMAEKSKFEEELEKLNINLTEHQKERSGYADRTRGSM